MSLGCFAICMPSRHKRLVEALLPLDLHPVIVPAVDRESSTLFEDAFNGGHTRICLNDTPKVQYNNDFERFVQQILNGNELFVRLKSKCAVHMAHNHALDAFKSSEHDFGLIFEDDVVAGESALRFKELESFISEIHTSTQFDVFYLGRSYDEPMFSHKIKGKFSVEIRTVGACLSRHAYVVTKESVDCIRSVKIWPTNSGDLALQALIQSGAIKAISCTPPMFYQDRTNLGSHNGNHQAQKVYRTWRSDLRLHHSGPGMILGSLASAGVLLAVLILVLIFKLARP